MDSRVTRFKVLLNSANFADGEEKEKGTNE